MSELTNAVASGRPAKPSNAGDNSSATTSTEFRAVTWLAIWLANVRKALAMLKQGTPAAQFHKDSGYGPEITNLHANAQALVKPAPREPSISSPRSIYKAKAASAMQPTTSSDSFSQWHPTQRHRLKFVNDSVQAL